MLYCITPYFVEPPVKYFHVNMPEKIALATFRKLSFELHPDKGGNPDDFIIMKKEYEDYKAIRRHWIMLNAYFRNLYYRTIIIEKPLSGDDVKDIITGNSQSIDNILRNMYKIMQGTVETVKNLKAISKDYFGNSPEKKK